MTKKFLGEVKNGKIEIYDKNTFAITLSELEDKEITLEIQKHKKQRTKRQNNALHLYFELLARELNESGQDMRQVLKESVDIEWTADNVKNYLWRPIQKSILGKKSTTKLKTDDINKVYEPLNRFLGEKTGVYVPFPSIEEDLFL
ncbi:MAG: hypothetical protein GF387_00490 [Candidatus Portnoybacteria bacterium]|nr:hypothetical protein [Candidatus Portnoybacteria bacterium]